MRYRLKKSSRLLKSKDFFNIIKLKKVLEGKYLKIHYKKHSANFKLGITTPIFFGNAVERNKFKRTIREIFRCFQDKKKLEIIVKPKKWAKKASFSAIQEEFYFLIKKI